jgi:hypothetical protein
MDFSIGAGLFCTLLRLFEQSKILPTTTTIFPGTLSKNRVKSAAGSCDGLASRSFFPRMIPNTKVNNKEKKGDEQKGKQCGKSIKK